MRSLYKQAVPLQRFLLGWSGALQRMPSTPKKAHIGVKKTPTMERPLKKCPASRWSDPSRVLHQAARESVVGKFTTSISFAEQVESALQKPSGMLSSRMSLRWKPTSKHWAWQGRAGRRLWSLAEMVKGAGSLINKATEELAKLAPNSKQL